MAKTGVDIISVTGSADVESARILCKHPKVRLTSVTVHSAAGQAPGDFPPHGRSPSCPTPHIGKNDERIIG